MLPCARRATNDSIACINDFNLGQGVLEDILRSGNCPLAAEFLELISINGSTEP
jgi:hypothetical protein